MNTSLDESVDAEEESNRFDAKKITSFKYQSCEANDSITSAKRYHHKFWW